MVQNLPSVCLKSKKRPSQVENLVTDLEARLVGAWCSTSQNTSEAKEQYTKE